MTTLATLVSQQIWPQLHVLGALRPERLVLLHSANRRHGVGPASRLRAALERWRDTLGLDWVPRTVEAREISDYDPQAVSAALGRTE